MKLLIVIDTSDNAGEDRAWVTVASSSQVIEVADSLTKQQVQAMLDEQKAYNHTVTVYALPWSPAP